MLRPWLGAILTRAAHKFEAAPWLMKCHWDCSILKAHFIYYIAPPYTHLLFVKHAHDYDRCYRSTALHNLQYDHFLIFLLHIDRCRRRTALSRFPGGAMSHSHPYAVTHPIPTTLSHTHCCCGLMVQWWRNESLVSLKGHFRSLWAFVCFCMCKLAVSGKQHNEGVDGVCPVPAWWCRAGTGWHKGSPLLSNTVYKLRDLSQSISTLMSYRLFCRTEMRGGLGQRMCRGMNRIVQNEIVCCILDRLNMIVFFLNSIIQWRQYYKILFNSVNLCPVVKKKMAICNSISG